MKLYISIARTFDVTDTHIYSDLYIAKLCIDVTDSHSYSDLYFCQTVPPFHHGHYYVVLSLIIFYCKYNEYTIYKNHYTIIMIQIQSVKLRMI